MKKFFCIFASLLTLAAVFSCKEKDEGKKEEDTRNSEARLIALKAIITPAFSDFATVHNDDNPSADFYYAKDEADLYKTVLLEAKVSTGAKTNIKEDVTYDLVEGFTIIVVSEDEAHSTTYNVSATEGTLSITCEQAWEKKASAANLTYVNNQGPNVGFATADYIVYVDGNVVSREDAQLVGTLNMDGCEVSKLRNVTNDENGIIIGSMCTSNEGSTEAINFYVYAWLDGWDKAPTKLLEAINDGPMGGAYRYMSCGGDVKGDFILNFISNANEPPVLHNVYTFKDGDYANPSWTGFYTDYPRNDGNWGQMISPASSDVNGWWFIGDSQGNNNGYRVFARKGVQASEDIVLYGTGIDDGHYYVESELNHQYGHYSVGDIRAFSLRDKPYVATASTSWGLTYLTIQTVTDPNEDDSHYLLRTQAFGGSQQAPSVAFIFDAQNNVGYVAMVSGGHDNGIAEFVTLYEITTVIY